MTKYKAVAIVLLISCGCSSMHKASRAKVSKVLNTMKADTVYSDAGLVIYEHTDSLYVVRLDNGQVVNRHVVNKGYTWKQLYTVTLLALTAGIFIHFFFDKL
jgi:uncharacterized protein YcfL